MAGLTAWQFLIALGHDHPSPFQAEQHRPVPLGAGTTVLVNGAAGGVGHVAVQLAKWRGARVIAVASGPHESFLRDLGVDEFIDYTENRPEEVAHDVDLVLDTVGGALPDLIRIVDGNPKRVLSIADREGPQLGVRGNYDEGLPLRYETFGEMAQAAADGKFSIPIARTFPLQQWREAMEISLSGKASGKLLLVPTALV